VSFASPDRLLALLLLPLLAAGYVALDRRRATRAAAWAQAAMFPNAVRRTRRRLGLAPQALLLLGLALLLVGFARPQRVLPTGSRQPPTIVIAFDSSGSMAADDANPTRFGVEKRIATRFLRELPTRFPVAVVTFASSVHLAVPPTLDRQEALAGLPGSVTRLGGTALGDGIDFSVAVAARGTNETSPGSVDRPGAVLLFSDGAQTSGGASSAQAAVTAVVDYVPVDVVSVGTKKGAVSQPVVVDGVHATNRIPVPAQPAVLQTLARQTSGFFFDASKPLSPAKLARVYAAVDAFPLSTHRTRTLSALAAAVALVLVLGGLALSGFWSGRLA
jgi:Ca-activated chloride channel family protein